MIHQARPDLTVVFKNYDDDDNDNNSLRGRRLKGKWKGDLGARETRGARGAPLAPKTPFLSLSNERFPPAQNPLSLPFQTPATQAMIIMTMTMGDDDDDDGDHDDNDDDNDNDEGWRWW